MDHQQKEELEAVELILVPIYITRWTIGPNRIHQNATMLLRLSVTAVFATLASAQVASQPSGWPQFKYRSVPKPKTEYKYNPTGEFIFPSVFHAGAYLELPLGEWYLYYAPHENPGGISLLYANSLDGPWTEYPAQTRPSSTGSCTFTFTVTTRKPAGLHQRTA
jgi:hypothetical protein